MMIEYTVEVYNGGDKYWYLNGELHREDGPAKEFADGSKFWYLNGKLHRVDGPAVELVWGYKYWYLNGVEFSEADFNKTLEKPKTIVIDGVTYTLEKTND